MKFSKFFSGILVLSGVMVTTTAFAVGMDATQKKQVEGIVSDYISQHPEDIIKSLQSYQQKQMSKTIEKTHAKAIENADMMFRQQGDPVAGNLNGKVTVVEFFDYQCAHCINMRSVFDAVLSKNPEVKIVYKEFPIRGPMSELAAKVALAAMEQGKYKQVHDALLKAASKKRLDEKTIYDSAKQAGLNIKKLKKIVKSKSIDKKLKQNYELARKLELMGTPAIFIANSNVDKNSSLEEVVFIPGETSTEHLHKVVQKMLTPSSN